MIFCHSGSKAGIQQASSPSGRPRGASPVSPSNWIIRGELPRLNITPCRRSSLIRPESQCRTLPLVFCPADNEQLFIGCVSKLLLAHSLLELLSQGLPLHSQLSLASVSALAYQREKESETIFEKYLSALSLWTTVN